ncbi:MAG: hypothetical protein RL113_1222 [Pseudomonadota bacterium]|jgi:uncharacterized protein (DUF2062 family)
MIRKVFKKKNTSSKIDAFLEKYHLPKAYLSINRRMVSRGVGVGLFWAFIPMPMQMLAVMATTPFVQFNVPIAISMVWLSNPFTMPPMYYMEYLTGNFILGREGIANIELTMEWFSANLEQILLPLYVGTAFYSVVVTGGIYFLINHLWVQSVHREKRERFHRRLKQMRQSKKHHPKHK